MNKKIPFSISSIQLTTHAQQRIQQRGIPLEVVNIILKHYSTSAYVKNGLSLSITRSEAKRLGRDGVVPPSMVDKIHSVYVIVSCDNEPDKVVTVMHERNTKKWRHYRKTVKFGKTKMARLLRQRIIHI